MHGSIADTSYFLHEGVPTDAPFLSPIALLTAGEAFRDAARVATAPQYKRRVDVAKMAVLYVVLLRWSEVQMFARNASVSWPWEATKQSAWQEFTRVWDLIGIVSIHAGGCGYTCLKAQVFGKALKSDDIGSEMSWSTVSARTDPQATALGQDELVRWGSGTASLFAPVATGDGGNISVQLDSQGIAREFRFTLDNQRSGVKQRAELVSAASPPFASSGRRLKNLLGR